MPPLIPCAMSVLSALSNQPMLVSMLESAEWSLEANSLIANVASSATMIDMSLTSDARRIATAAASGQAGRPIKVQVVPGGTAQASCAPAVRRRMAVRAAAPSKIQLCAACKRNSEQKFAR